ncbi:MAG: hypothetical protein KAZ45_03235 [Arenimonas sp.]|nr:hypothetical protein [Arenimonas sp.]
MIVHRTELADIELNASRRTLSLLERRLLLFADGRRSIDEIRTLVNAPNAGELLYLLEKNGFLSQGKSKQAKPDESPTSAMDEIMGQLRPLIAPIAASGLFAKPKTQRVNVSPAMIRPAPDPARAAMAAQAQALLDVERPAQAREPAIDEDAKLAIKRIIIETSGEHLGIFSRELLDKTDRAQDATQLRACISQWHMAMQDSRSGREKCISWLNEVNELLHDGKALALKSA